MTYDQIRQTNWSVGRSLWFWDMYTKPLALFWKYIKWQLGVDLACIVYTKPACVSVGCLDIHGGNHVSMNRPHGWRGHGLLWLHGFQSSEVALQQQIRITPCDWSPYLMFDCELVAELFGWFCFWLAEFIFWCEDRRSMHCERTQNCVTLKMLATTKHCTIKRPYCCDW